MYNLQHIIFTGLFYIGLVSPFVFIACCVIICSSQYLKQKSKENKKINNLEKKYPKQNQSNYATYSDASGSSTQSLWIAVENPNEHSYQLEDNHSKRNSSRNSIKTSFVNLPNERHFKYSDSMLLLPKTGPYENTPQSEIHINPDHLPQKKITAPKSSMGHICSKYGDTQENIYNDNPKKCKCNGGNKKPYITQSKVKMQDHFTGDMKFDNASLNIHPVELVRKISGRTDKLYDEEFRTSSLENASKNYRKSDTNILNEKFQQYGIGNNQECPLAERNESSQFNINEKCQFCTISKEKNSVSEMHKTECVPQSSYNPQRNNKHHRDTRNSVFQNRNIPIAKRVLEDDQFYDLRQKFYNAENTFQNAPHPKKYEPSFNTLIKNKQIYQFDEKLHRQNMKQHLTEESIQDSCTQHAAQNITKETRNENQAANSPSTCNSSGKEELLCQFWKSLKTEIVDQKRNKSIQTEVPHIEQRNGELFLENYATDSDDYYKKKFQEVMSHIESKQDVTAKKSVLNSTQNESAQTHLNERQCIQKKLPQSQDRKYCPQAQPFSTQMPDDIRTIENKMCRSCQVFLPPTDYSKRKEIKPITSYSKPTMMQNEFQHTFLEPLRPDNAQLIENTEIYQCSDNCYLRPNFSMKHEDMCERCNADNCSVNKNNYVCNPIMLLNHFENKQSLNPNYNTRQKMHFQCGNMPLNNPCINSVQCGQCNKYRHTMPSMEKVTNYRNEYTHQQRGNKMQCLNCESFNIIPAVAQDCNTNNISTNNFYNQPRTTWHDENIISQENELYDRHTKNVNEDNLIHPSSHDYKNSRSQTHNVIETDMKGAQISEEPALLSSSHEKHCNKQLAKEKVNSKSNSKIETDKQVLEKSTADQNHPKQSVEKMRIIKRMYPQIDQNIHETNKNVINEVKSVLQKTGKWKSEDN